MRSVRTLCTTHVMEEDARTLGNVQIPATLPCSRPDLDLASASPLPLTGRSTPYHPPPTLPDPFATNESRGRSRGNVHLRATSLFSSRTAVWTTRRDVASSDQFPSKNSFEGSFPLGSFPKRTGPHYQVLRRSQRPRRMRCTTNSCVVSTTLPTSHTQSLSSR